MRILIAFISIFALLSSCWPTKMSFVDGSIPDEWKKFFITPLEIQAATAPANYNSLLSESLRSGIQNNTRLKLANDADSAQVLISGIVKNYSTTPLAITEGDNAAKTRLTISVDFTIVTPTKGLEKMTMNSTRFADFDASQNLGDVENQLIDAIDQQIVQDVFNKLLSNW